MTYIDGSYGECCIIIIIIQHDSDVLHYLVHSGVLGNLELGGKIFFVIYLYIFIDSTSQVSMGVV